MINFATSVVLVLTEGYGKAFFTADLPVNVAWDAWGGTFTFGLNTSASSKIYGLADVLNFDIDQALQQLEAAIDLPDDAGETLFDLSGDLVMSVDKANDKVKVRFVNDSMVITKSSVISEFSIGYSRKWEVAKHGNLYWGVKPKALRVGLTQAGQRVGDVTDSEALFDDIKDADFNYSSGLSLDLGAIWQADHYHLGATLVNINEPEFDFPDLGVKNINDTVVLAKIVNDSTYTMERQLKLQGGFHTSSRRWTANVAYDVNEVRDPMGDKYQWASISGGYNTKSWWVPGVRAGVHSNLAGSKLTYVGVGITLFKYLDLDIASTLDTVELEGDKLPRGAHISLGLSFAF